MELPTAIYGRGFRIQKTGTNTSTAHIDSVDCLPGAAEASVKAMCAAWGDATRARMPSTGYEAKHSWDLKLGYDGALAMARTGRWQKGLDLMAEGRRAVRTEERMQGEAARVLSVFGTSPCIPAAMGGSPAHMWRMTEAARQTAQRPIVRIGVHYGMPASVNAEHASKVGVAILQVIDAVERSGARVQLTAYEDSSLGINVRVGIKASDAPMSMAALSVMVNPATSRRLKFTILEVHALVGLGLTNLETAYDATMGHGRGMTPAAGEFDAFTSFGSWGDHPDTVAAQLIKQIENSTTKETTA